MTNRCSKCGRNNYGDIKKCSFCGTPLVFIPGEEVPVISEEDVQEKMSKMKVPRIRNPFLIGSGGAITVVGFFIAVALFFIIMLFVYDPTDVEPYYDSGIHYNVPGGEEYIFGEITLIKSDADARWSGDSHGYEGWTGYEINGDGVDNRAEAIDKKQASIEGDTWVYAKDDIGEKEDKVLIKVVSKENDFRETRAVYDGKAPWGGSGWITGGWIFALPGLLITVTGGIMLTLGLVGKADRSMERLMAEDKELRRQQIRLREAARKKMEEQHKSQQWSSPTPDPGAQEQPPVQEQVPTAIPQEVMGAEPVSPAPTQPEAQQPQVQQQPAGAPAYQPPQPQPVPQQEAQPQYQAPPPAAPPQQQPAEQQYQPPQQ